VPVEVAPDGSPVEIYRRLPPGGEAELIHGAVGRHASILELGCGAGRVTHELVRLGHWVTAVDESAEMLAHVRGAEVVETVIEELDLGRTETRFQGDVAITLSEAAVDGAVVSAAVEYAVDGRRWRQAFTARMLDEEELRSALHEAGLEGVRWLDERRSWSEARPCKNRAS
jgi:SAM-dependent methyltransferase